MKDNRRKNRAGRRRSPLQKHKTSVVGIIAILLLLVAVVTVSSVSLRARNKEYLAQEAELQEQIEAEEERAQEISELEEYVSTDEYIEQTAKDKLGLVHENEIIFKRK